MSRLDRQITPEQKGRHETALLHTDQLATLIQGWLRCSLLAIPKNTSDEASLWAMHHGSPKYRWRDSGFKLHISATIHNAADVATRVASILFERGVPFKLLRCTSFLQRLNAGEYGVTQIGKFVTIYPSSDSQASELAQVLDTATRDLNGPAIPSDIQLRPHSSVWFRFGSFSSHVEESATARLPGHALAFSKLTPFPFTREREEAAARYTSALKDLEQHFVILDVVQRRGKSTIYNAIELRNPNVNDKPRRCVLKRGHAAGDLDRRGIDGAALTRREHHILELLIDCRITAVPYRVMSYLEDVILAMEHVGDASLRDVLLHGGTIADPIRFVAKLCEGVAEVHRRGVVLRDISPGNVVIQGDVPRVVDLEHSWYQDDAVAPSQVITPGFSALETLHKQESDTVPPRPRPGDDIFALGAVLRAVLQPVWYREIVAGAKPVARLDDLDSAWQRVISQATSSAPRQRLRSADDLAAQIMATNNG